MATFIDYAREAARRAGIDPEIFIKQIQQESGFNPTAKSPAGAQGIAQIMPQYHPGVDSSDPYASLDYAANLDAQHLKQFGGDWSKALAAYNAGAGNVQKYGGVPPFEETQRYVSSILGGGAGSQGSAGTAAGAAPAAQPPTQPTPVAQPAADPFQSMAMQLLRGGANPRAVAFLGGQGAQTAGVPATSPTGSPNSLALDFLKGAGQQTPSAMPGGNIVPDQFGDKSLTPEEAYAACGPAAAVAMAQGKVTLRQALDLAKAVGWTPQGGMNGIANQKKFLDKLGVANRLDTAPSAAHIQQDAASGNPVTISTPGHYFVANGFDPRTQKLYVGKSGTAFKNGSDWLTLDEMRSLGGGINGALFVDHPGSPTPSVAAA